jgi:septal ring factor EnvC (AmiA/AmiB activator)
MIDLTFIVCFTFALALMGLVVTIPTLIFLLSEIIKLRMQVKEVKKKMATLEEQLGDIKGILEKANTEITNELVKLNQKIADLEASLGQLTPTQQEALDAVKAAAIAIDDKIPDVPV